MFVKTILVYLFLYTISLSSIYPSVEEFLCQQYEALGQYVAYTGKIDDCFEPEIYVRRTYNKNIVAQNPLKNYQFATTSNDPNSDIKIDIWNFHGPILTFKGHIGQITGLTFHNNILYSSSMDGIIRFYNLNNFDMQYINNSFRQRILIDNAGIGITCMTKCRYGSFFITGDCKNIVRVWDPKDGGSIGHFDCNRFNSSVECEEKITTLNINAENNLVFIGSSNGAAIIWNLESESTTDSHWNHIVFKHHPGIPCTATFSHDSKYLVVSLIDDQISGIRCWNIQDIDKPTFFQSKSVMLWGPEEQPLPHHAKLLNFSEDDRTLTALLNNDQVVQWKFTHDIGPVLKQLNQLTEEQINLYIEANNKPLAFSRCLGMF